MAKLTLANFKKLTLTRLNRDAHAFCVDDDMKSIASEELDNSRAMNIPLLLGMALKMPLADNDLIWLQQVGLAMFAMWRAYTILDDVLDGQQGTERSISMVAWMRLGAKYLDPLYEEGVLDRKLMGEAFAVLEDVYAWETKVLRGGDVSCNSDCGSTGLSIEEYEYIARRMEPYLVALEAVARRLAKERSDIVHIREFFRLAVTIDQLRDDLMDWREDLSAGRITYITHKCVGRAEEFGVSEGEALEGYVKLEFKKLLADLRKRAEKEIDSMCKVDKDLFRGLLRV